MNLAQELLDAGVSTSTVLKVVAMEDELQNLYNQLVEERSHNESQTAPSPETNPVKLFMARWLR